MAPECGVAAPPGPVPEDRERSIRAVSTESNWSANSQRRPLGLFVVPHIYESISYDSVSSSSLSAHRVKSYSNVFLRLAQRDCIKVGRSSYSVEKRRRKRKQREQDAARLDWSSAEKEEAWRGSCASLLSKLPLPYKRYRVILILWRAVRKAIRRC